MCLLMSPSGETSLKVEGFNVPGDRVLFALKEWEINLDS